MGRPITAGGRKPRSGGAALRGGVLVVVAWPGGKWVDPEAGVGLGGGVLMVVAWPGGKWVDGDAGAAPGGGVLVIVAWPGGSGSKVTPAPRRS